MESIREPARSVPVIHEADICVLGGSCTGVFAAVRAARLGAKVVIVEKQNAFGGVAASGLVNIWHSLLDAEFNRQIIAGLTQETVERLRRRDAVGEESRNHSVGYVLNTEELKIELDELAAEAGIKIYLHTLFVCPHIQDGELRAAIVENKSGRGAIRAKLFIDATGDGDLCVGLGIDHRISPAHQPSTTCAKISGWGENGAFREDGLNVEDLSGIDLSAALRKYGEFFRIPEGFGWGRHVPNSRDVYMYAGTRVYDGSGADADGLTSAEIEGRRQVRAIMDLIRKHAPTNRLSLVSLPSYIGTRESRHIDCLYRFTGEDMLTGKAFDDAIANGSYRVDIHHRDKPGLTLKYLNGEEVYLRPGYPKAVTRWREPTTVNPAFYQIPYRSMLPVGPYRNVIIAGRMLDFDDLAFGGARVMVNMNQTGEAAGVAAYLALSEARPFDRISAERLRRKLKEGGSIVL
ncbi:FAD-dependent oxidoreductase [Cohnella faecalis]|uniref:FAD-dependent oxidoreductase n=1 Tax=Cohnella faecalis TaxID=2315694 RepID=UPI00361C753B